MKLFLTASILAAAIVLSGCETMTEVDKALYTGAEKFTPKDTVTGKRTLNLTERKDQIIKGNAPIDEQIAKARAENSPLNEQVDAEGYARLQRIFTRIHSVSHFSNEKWDLILLPVDKFNAFVTGGTYIVVFKGLLDELKTDDEIAAVLGHEMAHVAAGHLFEHDAHTKVLGLVGKKSVKQEGYNEAFTNIDEQEADRVGILYAALAGYDPKAASKIWSRMAVQRKNEWSYFRDHPANDERAYQTNETASKFESYYIPGEANPSHAELLACNNLWCKNDRGLKPGEGGGVLSVFEGVLDTLAKNQEAKTERARQEYEMARQQYEQKTGVQLPSRYSYSSADVSAIKFNRPYRGVATYPARNATLKSEMWFIKNYSGGVDGVYTIAVQGHLQRGKLKLIKQLNPGQYEFEWENNGSSGLMQIKFSNDGASFEGAWHYQGRPHDGGTWTGRS